MKTHTIIGCEYHSNEDWKDFNDQRISRMDSNALEFWTTHKELILKAVETLNGENLEVVR